MIRGPGKTTPVHRLARSSSFVFWVASAVACLPQAPSEPTRVTRAAIVAGDLDDGDPSVVGIAAYQTVFCTGTVISERVVITAAHCVAAVDRAGLAVFFGGSVEIGGRFIPVDQLQVHPSFGRGSPLIGDDLALLVLAEPAPTLPVPLAFGGLGADL